MKSIKISDAAHRKLKIGAARRDEHVYQTVDYLLRFLGDDSAGRRLAAIVNREQTKTTARNGRKGSR